MSPSGESGHVDEAVAELCVSVPQCRNGVVCNLYDAKENYWAELWRGFLSFFEMG